MKKIDLHNWVLSTENNGKINVNIPCDVTNDLYIAGIIDDPIFGDNLKNINYIFHKDWTYECVFSISEEDLKKENIFISFDGIDTLSEITLNGHIIGKTDNMFVKYVYNIKDYVVTGDNYLSVTIYSATDYCDKLDEHLPLRSIFTTGRLYLRKAQCHFGWDWAPNLPGAGIYLPVYIEIFDGCKIDNIYIKTTKEGNIDLSVNIFGKSFEGYKIVAQLGGKKILTDVVDNNVVLNTFIENPRLWWPNGYGESFLYDYSIQLVKNNEIYSERKGKFGFKEIRLIQEPIENEKYSFYFLVNGVRIFAKGANWVPISNMTGAIKDEDYTKLLTIAKESNMNMLRVWGGGIYEKEIFYDLCDELGIIVWQDFAFSCSVIPAEIKGIEENFLIEAEYQVKRIRNHASLGILCGGNENYINFDKDKHEKAAKLVQVTLKDLCEKLSDAVYLYNSPSSFLGEDEYGERSGDVHLSSLDATIKRDAFDDFRKVITIRDGQFISESALLGPTRKRSLKKFIPFSSLEKIDDIWDFHFVKNPYSNDCSDSFINKEIKYSERFFGKIKSINDFLKKGMSVHLEMIGAELDYARSNVNCSGYMPWMYNDNWGCGTWSLVDYYFEKKPALYRLKRGFENIVASATVKSDGTYAFVVNDLNKKISGTLLLQAKNLEGIPLCEKKISISVEPYSVKNIIMSFFDNIGDYISVCFISEGKEYKSFFFRNQWKDLNFVSSLLTDIKKVDTNKYKVIIKAKQFAKNVFIDYPDNDGIFYSDNFFDMENGDYKEVEILTQKPIEISKIVIKTFADEWDD